MLTMRLKFNIINQEAVHTVHIFTSKGNLLSRFSLSLTWQWQAALLKLQIFELGLQSVVFWNLTLLSSFVN